MTAPAIGQTSQQQLKPYLSNDEFSTNRRRGVAVNNLVPGGGSAADQQAALAQILLDASQTANDMIFQVLHATYDTVVDQVRVNRQGAVEVFPRYWPIIALTAFSVGPAPDNLAELSTLTGAGVKLRSFTVPAVPAIPLVSNQGPLQFGSVLAPMDGAWAQYTTVNGFPHCFMTAAAEQGATQISVDDTTGMVAGRSVVTVYAGRNRHVSTVSAVSNAVNGLGTGPGTVTLSTALPYAVPNSERYPTMVSALPGSFLEGVALIARSMIKQTSAGNVSATTTTGSASRASDPLGAGDDMVRAEKLLAQWAAIASAGS